MVSRSSDLMYGTYSWQKPVSLGGYFQPPSLNLFGGFPAKPLQVPSLLLHVTQLMRLSSNMMTVIDVWKRSNIIAASRIAIPYILFFTNPSTAPLTWFKPIDFPGREKRGRFKIHKDGYIILADQPGSPSE